MYWWTKMYKNVLKPNCVCVCTTFTYVKRNKIQLKEI